MAIPIPCYVYLPEPTDQIMLKADLVKAGFNCGSLTTDSNSIVSYKFDYVVCNQYGHIYNLQTPTASYEERVDCGTNIELFKHLANG